MKTDFLRQAMETDWSAAIGPEYGRMVVTLVDRLRALEGWLPTPGECERPAGRYPPSMISKPAAIPLETYKPWRFRETRSVA